MNKKYEKYINYFVSDLEAPYFKNMVDRYGLRTNEYSLVLSKIYKQPVTIKGDYVYDSNGNIIYFEESYGYWRKYEYDTNGNIIYYENSNGDWIKYGYDNDGNEIYYGTNNGVIIDNR